MGTAVVTWWPLPPLPAECHPQPACISGSSQRPECQPRSPGVELSVATHALFTLFTWRTRFLLRFRSPWGGGLSKHRPAVGCLAPSCRARDLGWHSLSPEKPWAVGSLGRGQSSGFWSSHCCCSMTLPLPGSPFGTCWRGALLRSQSTCSQIILSYPHCSPVGPVLL